MTCDIGGRIPDIFPEEPIEGTQFWQLISSVTPRLTLAMRHDIVMPEVLYPYTSNSTRFSAETGVPVILQTTLPHLSDDYEALYDELREPIMAQPRAPVGEQYKYLFNWLRDRLGKRMWVERCGGEFVIINEVYASFPEARFIHIVRDGRDTALSIHNHIGFRLFIMGTMLTEMLGVDPYISAERTHLDRIPAPLQAFLPENFDAEAFRSYRIPLNTCGALWSQQIDSGLRVLGQLPKERVLTLRYEDILTEPTQHIERMADFLGEEYRDPHWVKQCAAMVRKPRHSWRDLPPDDARELSSACQPGLDMLREIGVSYPALD